MRVDIRSEEPYRISRDKMNVLARAVDATVRAHDHTREAPREDLATSGSWSGELLLQRKNGSEFPAWLSINNIVNDEGEITASVISTRDLTEERRVARGRKARTFGDSAQTRGRSSYRRPGDIAKRFCSSEVSGAFGTMTAVPSQLMPAKPVVTLSITPSRTDVITTSTKTPSINSVSVSVERSLWAHSVASD